MDVLGEAKDERDDLGKDKPEEEQPIDASLVQTSQPQETIASSTDQADANIAENGHEPPVSSVSTIEPPIEAYEPSVEEEKPATGKKLGRLELPEVWPTADLSQPATKKRPLAISMALCFTIAFAVYVSLIPRFTLYSNPPTGDQPFYLMDALS